MQQEQTRRQKQQQLPPLTYLANQKITQQQYKQNKELVQDLLHAAPSVRWSTPFYRMRSRSAGRSSIPEEQVKTKALEKSLKIFSHIREKEKTGFDVFPLFFIDVAWVAGLQELWGRFGEYTNLDSMPNDRSKSLFYIGDVNDRFYWFIVNWFNDRNKKLFVVYEKKRNAGIVSPFLRVDHYGNINVPKNPPYSTIDYDLHFQKLDTFFKKARLIGVYPIDYGFRYNFGSRNWVVPRQQQG